MPKLKCKVEKCAYNYDWLCSKNYIDVDGPSAKRKDDTCCKSYIDRSLADFNVEFATFGSEQRTKTEVYCDATNCVFEKGQKCYADRIEILSETEKFDQQSTKSNHCQTFECTD